MRALVQTVQRASVTVDGTVVGAIGAGLLVLVGVTHSDTVAVAKELARKAYELRILDDERSAAEGRGGHRTVPHPHAGGERQCRAADSTAGKVTSATDDLDQCG